MLLEENKQPTLRARVSAAAIAASIDAIRELLGLEFVQPLYRYVSRKAGVHPTTLLRYHRGQLETAPHSLALFLLRLRRAIARGHRPPLDGRCRRKIQVAKQRTARRVKNARVQRLLLDLIDRLRVPRNMFYRQVGAAVGLHPITVLRHAEGQLATAPRRLFDYLSSVALALDAGQEVVFTRAKLGTRVVPGEFVVQEVHRLMGMRVFPSQRSLLRFVASSLQTSLGSLERVFSSRHHVLVPEEVLHFLRALVVRLEYAPEQRYDVGDRIFHPVFGSGVVVGKEPRDKLAVEFADGARRVLREGLIEMREWDRRESWLDEAGATVNGSR